MSPAPDQALSPSPAPEELILGGATTTTTPKVRLAILEARYGWAEDIWAPRVCSHAAGCKDVTQILQRDVKSSAGNFGKELHLNPDRRHQFMNSHLWPETAAGPPIPRKLAIRYRFENEHDPLDHGEIFELITAAVPYETVCVHITSLNSDPPSYPIAASRSGFEGLLGGGVQGGGLGGLGGASTNMNREGAGASTGSNIELLLSSHPGEAIVPKWRNTRNAWGQWDYIELGVGPIPQNNGIDSGCCPTAPLRVDYDGQFLALSKGSGAHIAHREMVFDVAMWKFEENNHLVLVKVHPGHSDVTRKGGGGRDFVVHADGTISPTNALQFVLGKRPDNGALALVPRGSAHVCVLKAVNGSGRASATAPSSLSVEGMRGKIDFLGLWKDNEDRALPIRMHVNPNDPGQVARAFQCLLREMRHRGAREGLLAAQSYNQMHWTCNLHATEEENYEKHGFIGYVDKVCKSSWSGKVHSSEGITFPSFSGRMDVLGGDWQNAVYKVTIDEDDFAGQQQQPAIFTTETHGNLDKYAPLRESMATVRSKLLEKIGGDLFPSVSHFVSAITPPGGMPVTKFQELVLKVAGVTVDERELRLIYGFLNRDAVLTRTTEEIDRQFGTISELGLQKWLEASEDPLDGFETWAGEDDAWLPHCEDVPLLKKNVKDFREALIRQPEAILALENFYQASHGVPVKKLAELILDVSGLEIPDHELRLVCKSLNSPGWRNPGVLEWVGFWKLEVWAHAQWWKLRDENLAQVLDAARAKVLEMENSNSVLPPHERYFRRTDGWYVPPHGISVPQFRDLITSLTGTKLDEEDVRSVFRFLKTKFTAQLERQHSYKAMIAEIDDLAKCDRETLEKWIEHGAEPMALDDWLPIDDVNPPPPRPATASDEKLNCPNPDVNFGNHVPAVSPPELVAHQPVSPVVVVQQPPQQQQQYLPAGGAQMVVLLQSPQPVQIGGVAPSSPDASAATSEKPKLTPEDLHKENMKRENEKAHARQQGMFVGLLGTMAVLPCCFCLAKVVGENGADIAEGAGEAVGVCGEAAGGCIKLVENLFK